MTFKSFVRHIENKPQEILKAKPKPKKSKLDQVIERTFLNYMVSDSPVETTLPVYIWQTIPTTTTRD
jgi:hypothetical protein